VGGKNRCFTERISLILQQAEGIEPGPQPDEMTLEERGEIEQHNAVFEAEGEFEDSDGVATADGRKRPSSDSGDRPTKTRVARRDDFEGEEHGSVISHILTAVSDVSQLYKDELESGSESGVIDQPSDADMELDEDRPSGTNKCISSQF
jgi:hypothetical protein